MGDLCFDVTVEPKLVIGPGGLSRGLDRWLTPYKE